MRAAVLLLGLLALVGCASPAPAGRTVVPVPVECREPVPDRPAMPTELLLPGASPWVLLRASLASRDRPARGIRSAAPCGASGLYLASQMPVVRATLCWPKVVPSNAT